MAKPLKVLVTGATGHQGGSVARQLVQKGHRVRALTRNLASPAAQALAGLGVELAQGNLEDRASVDHALAGMDAMYSVATPYERGGPEAETRQSILAADAAAATGAHVGYASVANADRHTGIPHFDSKFAVEEHIRARGIEATIIAPVYFMENAFFGLPQLRQGVYGSPLAPTRRLSKLPSETSALPRSRRWRTARATLASATTSPVTSSPERRWSRSCQT
jgi:uncharacterized protein YbjT (DUF2867 family)